MRLNNSIVTIAGIVGTAILGALFFNTPNAAAANTLVCTPWASNGYSLAPEEPQRLYESTEIGLGWSGHFVEQALVVDGTRQYVGYYDQNRQMTIAYRADADQAWQRYTIPGPKATTGWDSHNYIRIAIDSNGFIHVSGNMHVNQLAYWRSTKPHDITTLTEVASMGYPSTEQQVTYPRFMKLQNGALVFSYRDGGSSNGSSYFNIYNAATKTWSRLINTPLFDGAAESPDRNAYFTLSSAPNQDGFYEMTWVWRETPDLSTNGRLSYMRSKDLRNWETITGSPVSLPVTYSTAGVIVDDIPHNSGLFNNQERVGKDADGRTTITYSKLDTNGSNQLFVARANQAGNWQVHQVTNWTGTWDVDTTGTVLALITNTGTTPLPDGRLRLPFSCTGGNGSRTSQSIILNSTDLSVVGQVPNPTSGLPAVVGASDPTTPSTGLYRYTQVSGDSIYILKIQSQGINNDRPFPSVPPPHPVKLLVVRPYSAPSAPRDLSVDREGATTRLNWQAPRDNGGHAVTQYQLQYSTDNGATWLQVTDQPITELFYVMSDTDTSGYQFRVAAMNTLGTGSYASTIPDPTTSGETPEETPGVPNTGLPMVGVWWLSLILGILTVGTYVAYVRLKKRSM